MIRYPRPFRFRRLPVIPPDLRPQQFSFIIDPIVGSDELDHFLQIRRRAPGQQRPPIEDILSHLKQKGVINAFRITKESYQTEITLTRAVRLSPKLIANTPRLRRLFP